MLWMQKVVKKLLGKKEAVLFAPAAPSPGAVENEECSEGAALGAAPYGDGGPATVCHGPRTLDLGST